MAPHVPLAAVARAVHAADLPLVDALARVAQVSRTWQGEHGGELLAEADRRLALGSPPRLREVLGIRHQEVPLNRTLGWLLDPGASHGAGPLLLASFARWLGVEQLAVEAAQARVWCERSPEGWFGTRAPDLLARTPNAALLVENKVNAPEGRDQFADYQRTFARWVGPRAESVHAVMAPTPRAVPPGYLFRTHAELAGWVGERAVDPDLPAWVRIVLTLLHTDLTDAEPRDRELRGAVRRARAGAPRPGDLQALAAVLTEPVRTPWETP